MTKLNVKSNFIIMIVLSLFLVGSLRSLTNNIELLEKDQSDLQEQYLEALQDSGNNPDINEDSRGKIEGITSYEEHAPISITSNTDFNNTADAEGWPGNGSVVNPYIIQGLNITGQSGDSLIFIEFTNVYFQINNCLLAGGDYGLFLSSISNGLISNNTIVSNTCGCWLESSQNTIFFNNSFSDNQYGVYLMSSSNNNLLNNSFSSNFKSGVLFISSGNNRIVNNSFINSGLFISSGTLSDCIQAEVTNNTVNGKPLIYWQNINGGTIPSGAGQIILVNCQSVTITGQNISDTSGGLQVVHSSNVTISNNIASDNAYAGITLYYSTGNMLFNNYILDNYYEGIKLFYSENNEISNNTIAYNSFGILVEDSSISNAILNNMVLNNSYGIWLRAFTSTNTISGNTVSYNSNYGIFVQLSTNNDIYGNTISDNDGYGVLLAGSENNIIIWNDFKNNNLGGSSQGSDVSNTGLANTFDYNYWNEWTTPDMNSDGIVDNSYVIDGDSDNQDSHPLTSPSHLSPTIITFPNGDCTLNGIITIQWSSTIDQWGHMVTYTVYYSNDSGSTWFTLVSGLDDTSYQWDTTTVLDGSEYLLKVVATCYAGLTTEDVTDSTFTIQNAMVTSPSAPQSLTATAGELSIYLSWTAPSNDGGSTITGYRVYRGTSNGVYLLIFIASDTNYTDTLVNGSVTYYYVITAINAVGESAFSIEVSATPTTPATTQIPTTITTSTTTQETTSETTTTTKAAAGAFPGVLVILVVFSTLVVFPRRRKKT
ncbi:MAG: NosD domain-containing protein [Promethearchaeota archaeon]